MRKILTALVVFIVLLGVAVLAFIYSGIYNIAADDPHAGAVEWALETLQERSLHRRAEEIQAPPLDDPARIRSGLVHYHEMCVTCHGAPGVRVSEIGMGLNPTPPELSAEAEEESAGEIFWVVKHGIKMTGMPAFGVTHGDEEIWDIVAFVHRMPKLSPEEYQKMVQEAGLAQAGGGGHSHGGGGDHHQDAQQEKAGAGGHEHAPGTEPHEH